jgi:hypothetical protein
MEMHAGTASGTISPLFSVFEVRRTESTSNFSSNNRDATVRLRKTSKCKECSIMPHLREEIGFLSSGSMNLPVQIVISLIRKVVNEVTQILVCSFRNLKIKLNTK